MALIAFHHDQHQVYLHIINKLLLILQLKPKVQKMSKIPLIIKVR